MLNVIEKNKIKKMKTLLALAILIVVALTHIPVHACTAFMMSDGQRVLVGNNEDYNIPHTRVWFIPAENGHYGRVYFGYENWSPQGGMNDQGLFFDFFATKPLEVKLSKKRPKFQGPIIDTMAAECATVEDVLDLFSRYNLEFMLKFQMFVVDKTGDAAIIEGDQIIRKSGWYQVVTNFHQSKVEENRRPCEWYKSSCTQYKMAESMLTDGGIVSVAHFRDILSATHRNTLGARTSYSNIYDLKNELVYLFYLHNFDNEVVIDLTRSGFTGFQLWKGKAFLLISENTFSAGVVFAAVFKANRMGVVVGQETSGRVRFGSDPVTITLRNSKLTGSIPLAIYTLPGENPDRGVIPDIKISRSIDDYQLEQDKELEKIKELNKEDMSRS